MPVMCSCSFFPNHGWLFLIKKYGTSCSNPVHSWLTKYMRGTEHFIQILVFTFLTQSVLVMVQCKKSNAMQALKYFQASNKVFVLDFRKSRVNQHFIESEIFLAELCH